MSQITSISPHKKTPGLYSIFLDEKFAFSLSELELAAAGLKVGQLLTPKEREVLTKQYHISKCYNSALRYLALRPRSTKETLDFLVVRKSYSPDTAQAAIKKLQDQHYLDDASFAQLWVENRMKLRPRPKHVLRLELVKKGIEKDIIEQVLIGIDDDSQIDALKQIILQKSSQTKYQDPKKMTQLLISRGYSYGLIKKAFEQINSY